MQNSQPLITDSKSSLSVTEQQWRNLLLGGGRSGKSDGKSVENFPPSLLPTGDINSALLKDLC